MGKKQLYLFLIFLLTTATISFSMENEMKDCQEFFENPFANSLFDPFKNQRPFIPMDTIPEISPCSPDNLFCEERKTSQQFRKRKHPNLKTVASKKKVLLYSTEKTNRLLEKQSAKLGHLNFLLQQNLISPKQYLLKCRKMFQKNIEKYYEEKEKETVFFLEF